MKSQLVMCLLLVCAFAALFAPPAAAYWTTDGIYIGAAFGTAEPAIIPDGAGGAIIVWHGDDTGGYTDIYAQRVNSLGIPLWDEGGVALCKASGYQLYPEIATDGAGGAIVTWMDLRGGAHYDIYAQRVNASGTLLWTTSGIAICASVEHQYYPSIMFNGNGGAIIAWYDYRSGTNYDIYAQRVDEKGAAQWLANGVAVCTAANDQKIPALVSDGSGGAIIGWMDLRDGTYNDIYAQRVDVSGNIRWAANGIGICKAFGNQYYPTICSDGAGGAIITWWDLRAGGSDYNIYAQRVNSLGDMLWAGDGAAICTAAYEQMDPMIAPDGAGGAIITWIDERGGLKDIYAQRANSSGVMQWTADGIIVCMADGNQLDPKIAPDGAGGAVIAWHDYRSGVANIYVQRISALGAAQWASDGVAVCTAVHDQLKPAVASDGAGGAIAAWKDYRTGSAYEIYAQRVRPPGFPGGSWPRIEEAADIPEDEGGWVRLHVARSEYDGLYAGFYSITGYNVWRLVSGGAALAAMSFEHGMTAAESRALESFLAAPDRARGLKLSGATAAALGLPPGTWESLGFHAAMQEEYYDFAVPTKTDSTSAGNAWETYVVTVHTTVPTAYVASDPESGYSVDNLAPGAPEGLTAEQSFEPEGLELAWDENGEPDLWHYAVYRGTSADFVPSGDNRVAMPAAVGYFDADWRWDGGYYYKVSAVDRHGNESGFALLTPDGVTGIETPAAPGISYLSQNYPNPFNPTTRIAFGLAAPAHVSLRIYDAAGRLVRVLLEGDRPAGVFAELWDGRDSGGREVGSGIYFYRLTAGAFEQTRKMALMR